MGNKTVLDENTYHLNNYLFQQDKSEEKITMNEINPLELSGYSFEDVVKLARCIFLGEDPQNTSVQTLRRWAFVSWIDPDTDTYVDLFEHCMDCWWTDNCSKGDWEILESISKEAVSVAYEMFTGSSIDCDGEFDLDLAVSWVLE